MELAILRGQERQESQSLEDKKSLTENIDLGSLGRSFDYKTIFNKQVVLILVAFVLFSLLSSLQKDVCLLCVERVLILFSVFLLKKCFNSLKTQLSKAQAIFWRFTSN